MDRFTQIDDLVPDVLLDCPECSDRIAKHALRHILSAFLRMSNAWQTVFTGNLTADSGTVTLDMSGVNAMIETVYDVRLMASSTASDYDYPIKPSYYHCSSDGVITLQSTRIPTESITDGLQAKVSLVTDPHVDVVPTTIIREAGHILIPWAQAYLMMSANKPYSNPELAQMRSSEYRPALLQYINKRSRRRTNHSGGIFG